MSRTGMNATDSPSAKPRPPFRIIPEGVFREARKLSGKGRRLFASIPVHPHVFTALGFLSGAAAGTLFALNHPVGAGILVLVTGLFDILDGQVAVHTHRQSSFGAILDSSIDRYSEFFLYFGIAYHFRHTAVVWLPFIAFLGAVMVSYTRARAEGLGMDCQVGIMQRAERMILLSLTSLIAAPLGVFDKAMPVVLGVIAVLSHIASIQRIGLVRKLEGAQPSRGRDRKPGKGPPPHPTRTGKVSRPHHSYVKGRRIHG